MSRTPLFSVIIPVYNRADMLQQALESVFRQEFEDYEVIVIDDGSTDDLSLLIQNFQDRVIFLRQDNAGPGAARNRGSAVAQGEYLAFLDSDDLWFPWTLCTIAKVITATPSLSMILGTGVWFENVRQLESVCSGGSRYIVSDDYLASSKTMLWAGTGGLVVRRAEFHRVGGFSVATRCAEDLDLLLRLGTSQRFASIEQPATFAYRQHTGNSIHNLSESLRGIRQLIKNEKRGVYPGGYLRLADRLEILTRFVRPPSLAALRHQRFIEALHIYVLSLNWHIRQGRMKYILGFWITALKSVISNLIRIDHILA